MSNAIEKKTASPLEQFKERMEARIPTLKQMLPESLTPERFVKSVLFAYSRNADLHRCNQASVIDACLQAAEVGLEPSGLLGDGYLIPYGKECKFIPGYRGLMTLARRSGMVKSIEAVVVRANDDFDFWRDEKGAHVMHAPKFDDAPMRLVFCAMRIPGAGMQFEVMTRAQVDRVRASSRSGDKGPWKDHYEEMARKTVVRRALKYAQLSPVGQRALELMDEGEGVLPEGVEEAPRELPATGAERAKAALSRGKRHADGSEDVVEVSRSEETLGLREREPHPDGEPPDDVVLPGQKA